MITLASEVQITNSFFKHNYIQCNNMFELLNLVEEPNLLEFFNILIYYPSSNQCIGLARRHLFIFGLGHFAQKIKALFIIYLSYFDI